jgi:hypothetical protein
MTKKIATLILILCFISMSVNIASAINVEDELEAVTKNLGTTALGFENLSYYTVITAGPARINSRFKFIDGQDSQIDKIEDLMNIRFFKPDLRTVSVTNLTFEITYMYNVQKRSRLSYLTAYTGFSGNTSKPIERKFIYNSPHTITVKNFTGIFHFLRPTIHSKPPMFKLFVPAQFIFVGFAREIIIHTASN